MLNYIQKIILDYLTNSVKREGVVQNYLVQGKILYKGIAESDDANLGEVDWAKWKAIAF
jgi:hypothetical protein